VTAPVQDSAPGAPRSRRARRARTKATVLPAHAPAATCAPTVALAPLAEIGALFARAHVRRLLSISSPRSPNALALCREPEPSCANADTRPRTPTPARDGDAR
jgi:hypothetical protein